MKRWSDVGRRVRSSVQSSWVELSEAQERMALLNRPWEEDYIHWVGEGAERRRHGHVPAPADGRPRSVTRGGWCPGQRATVPTAGIREPV